MKPGNYDADQLLKSENAFWTASSFTFGNWQFRPETGEVWKDGDLLKRLTVSQSETLLAIVSVYPLPISRRHILDRMMKMDVYWNIDTVKVIVSRLRISLGSDIIITLPQRGYRFNPSAVI